MVPRRRKGPWWLTGRLPWWIGLSTLFVLLCAPPAALAREVKKVIASHSDNSGLSPTLLFLSTKKGYFASEGIETVYVRARTTIGVTALVAGDVKFTMSVPVATNAIVKGARLRVIFAISDRPFYWLHSRTDIKSFQDLKGKTIGIAAFGTGPHLGVQELLRANGLDPTRDVVFRPAGEGRARFAALRAGSIDALATTTSSFGPAQRFGFNLLGYVGNVMREVAQGLVTTDRYLKEEPLLTKGFLRAMLKGLRTFHRKKEEVVAVMMEMGGADREEADLFYDEIVKRLNDTGFVEEEAMRLTVENARRETGAKQAVAVSEVFDLALIREANRELANWIP